MSQIRVEIDAVRRPQLEKFKDIASLILKEVTSDRYLPICISSAQADILTCELTSSLLVELMSPPGLFLSSISASHSDILGVTIRINDEVFYANALLYLENRPVEVKCPIGVALALAYRTQVPILVSNEIMNKWALTVHGE